MRKWKEKTKSMVFNISKFSEQLLNGLNNLPEWPNKVKPCKKIG